MGSQEERPRFSLHPFSESAAVTDGSSDGRSLCEVLAVEWPDLDRMHTHTASISLPSKHSHLTHTHTCMGSCSAAISHSVCSDRPQRTVTNTSRPVHLPAMAYHHTH